MSSCSMDCRRQCDSHPHEETCTHASPDGEAVSVTSSDSNLDFFSNKFLACLALLSKFSVGDQDQFDCFAKISTSFFESSSLGVSSRQFFNISDIPIIGFLKYCGKRAFHMALPPLMIIIAHFYITFYGLNKLQGRRAAGRQDIDELTGDGINSHIHPPGRTPQSSIIISPFICKLSNELLISPIFLLLMRIYFFHLQHHTPISEKLNDIIP